MSTTVRGRRNGCRRSLLVCFVVWLHTENVSNEGVDLNGLSYHYRLRLILHSGLNLRGYAADGTPRRIMRETRLVKLYAETPSGGSS